MSSRPRSCGNAGQVCRERARRPQGRQEFREVSPRTDAQWPRLDAESRSSRALRRFSAAGGDDAIDRRPRDTCQPVSLAFAEAGLDGRQDHLVALALHGMPVGSPFGEYVPRLADSQFWYAFKATLLQ